MFLGKPKANKVCQLPTSIVDSDTAGETPNILAPHPGASPPLKRKQRVISKRKTCCHTEIEWEYRDMFLGKNQGVLAS